MKTKLSRLFFALLTVGILFCSCQDCKKKAEEKQGCPKTSKSEQLAQKNKEIVLAFYQKMFGDKDLTAVDEYIHPDYIQHNPNVADGAAAFKAAATKWFEGAPKTKIDVQRTAAEDDLVFIHLKNKRPDGGFKSTIDIFRLEDGKIMEHWDVHQDVPENSANDHPMF